MRQIERERKKDEIYAMTEVETNRTGNDGD